MPFAPGDKTKQVPLNTRWKDYLYIIMCAIHMVYTPLLAYDFLYLKDYAQGTSARWPMPLEATGWLFPESRLAHNCGIELGNELWFQAILWFEMLFFVPFYPFAMYGIAKGKEWVCVPLIVYGHIHCIFAMLALIYEIWSPFSLLPLPLVTAFGTIMWYGLASALPYRFLRTDLPYVFGPMRRPFFSPWYK